jgi:hypothetical protein
VTNEEIRRAVEKIAPVVSDALLRERQEAARLGEAWDQGYAVAVDDFVHSDYCGLKCQCEGIHGQTNPYRTAPEETP